MRNNDIPFKQKLFLISLGVFLFIFFLEIFLRLGGFLFLFLQERKNVLSLKGKGGYRILCLGESTTALGGNDSYPSQLEKVLNGRNTGIKFSVINKGVASIDTTTILTNLTNDLNKYNPDIVVTMMGVNDYGAHLPSYKTNSISENAFSKFFKTYKLTKYILLHIVAKAKEIRSYKLNTRKDILYFSLGRIYNGRGKISQAEKAFKKAIEVNPKNDNAYIDLGWIYVPDGKLSQAEESFKKAIEVNPENDNAYIGLGWVYVPEGRFFQAAEMFKKAIRINPHNYDAYLALGGLCKKIGDLSQAEELYKKAIEIDPKNDKAYGSLLVLYKEKGNDEFARIYHKKAKELRLGYFNRVTANNYIKFKEILDKRGIKLVCVQYPMRSIEPLKKVFNYTEGMIFVDNEKLFKDVLNKDSYKEYFSDMFAGDFGHCTRKGNRLLAGNIADTVLKEVFNK